LFIIVFLILGDRVRIKRIFADEDGYAHFTDLARMATDFFQTTKMGTKLNSCPINIQL